MAGFFVLLTCCFLCRGVTYDMMSRLLTEIVFSPMRVQVLYVILHDGTENRSLYK